jgi:hypothetical protein
MWGYKVNGVIVAVNPNDMSGNTGWEKVPDGTVPELPEEPQEEPAATLEQRVYAVEETTETLTEIIADYLGV